MKERIKRIVGKRQIDGFLEIISFSHKENNGKRNINFYNFKCHNCGSITKKDSNVFHSQKSCGCLLKEWQKNKLPEFIKRTRTNDESQVNRLYSDYKNRSKNKKLSFNLNIDDFKILTQKECYYCGNKPQKDISKRIGLKNKNFNIKFIYNGIDRLNSNLGYNINNCVSCCYICNYAKRNLTLDEFYNWIENLINFRKTKQNEE
jgi:hypothetical protein